jgi:uncharacterized protein
VPDSRLAQFDRGNYISVETFRKSGQGIKTPVWFVRHEEKLYIYTEAGSGKVKRIRNNGRVRVALCDMRGTVKGPWIDGTASFIDGAEQLAADKLLDRKYFLKRIANLLPGRDRVWIKIEPA